MLLLPVLLIVAVASFLLFGSSLSSWRLWALALIMTAMVIVLGGVLLATGKGLRRRLESIRIGVSAEGFRFVGPPGPAPINMVEVGPVPWHEVYFDGRRLLAGRTALMIRHPDGREVFGRETFEREVVARIPPQNRVSPASMGLRQLKALPAWAKALHALTVLVLVVMFILTVFKQ